MSIKTKIDKIIKSLGSISIQDFVELSNFDDEGFYNLKDVSKISKKGHFITSPEITPLFGLCLCNQFLQTFKNTKKVHLLELGPGNGGDRKNSGSSLDSVSPASEAGCSTIACLAAATFGMCCFISI